jgi:hypothetical protein
MMELRRFFTTDQKSDRMDRESSPCPMWITPSYPSLPNKVRRGNFLEFPGDVVYRGNIDLILCSKDGTNSTTYCELWSEYNIYNSNNLLQS